MVVPWGNGSACWKGAQVRPVLHTQGVSAQSGCLKLACSGQDALCIAEVMCRCLAAPHCIQGSCGRALGLRRACVHVEALLTVQQRGGVFASISALSTAQASAVRRLRAQIRVWTLGGFCREIWTHYRFHSDAQQRFYGGLSPKKEEL